MVEHYELLLGAAQAALEDITFEVQWVLWFEKWYPFILNTMYAADCMGDKYDQRKLVCNHWAVASRLGNATGSFNMSIYIVKNEDNDDNK